MIDSLCDQGGGKNVAVACLYLDFAAQQEQSSTSMLGALLKQLVVGLEEVPGEIMQAYEEQKNFIGGRRPRQADVVKMLQTASSKKRTFICIDALDECVPEHRVKLLDLLNEIFQNSPGTRMFVTGRPYIRPEIGRCLSGRVTSLSISAKRDDIIRYLNQRLKEDTTPDAMNSSLKAEILKKIPQDVSEMYVSQKQHHHGRLPQASADRYISRFLLVSLNIDAILRETTIHRRRQKLSAITDGLELGDAYGATLGRIKGQGEEKARLGMAALMWISHSERPLKAEELCHALAVEIGSPNLDIDNVPSIGTLLACCQGLVVVEKEVSTVRLIHLTLQEYLRAHPNLFGAAHSTMAETCLSHLNSHQVKAFSTSPSPDLRDTPFLEYSSLYWGVHAKRDLSDCAKQLALKLFDGYDRHISARILLEAQETHWDTIDFNEPSLFSGLHCASFFGIVEIVACLVELGGCDINQMDFTGNTPLHWAAWNGHERVVKTLLGRDRLSSDKPDNSGRIPLHHAAWRGHEGVVKMLLGRDGVNPETLDENGRTPLRFAASAGREGVVKMLLELDDVNPDRPDNEGQTPLWWASFNGHEEVVKILLRRDDVDPNKPDNNGRTSLFIAACYGNRGVVRILLGRDDINPDKPDNEGQTPLWWAAFNGYEEVVKILLERDGVNPDIPDNNSRTPLFIATFYGHEGVVKTLLERDDVNPDKPDKGGQTPLWWAAWNGREGVLRMLLGRDCVNPDKPDNNGRTPLWGAAESGEEGVAKILLRRDDVNPNRLDKDGKTPLDRATERGNWGVIALLLPPESATPCLP